MAVRYATGSKWLQYRSKQWCRSRRSTFMTPMTLGRTIITTCFGTISRCIIIWNIGGTSCSMKLTPMIWTISTQMILNSLFRLSESFEIYPQVIITTFSALTRTYTWGNNPEIKSFTKNSHLSMFIATVQKKKMTVTLIIGKVTMIENFS